MTTSANQAAEPLAPAAKPANPAFDALRPFTWSLRREIWEHRSIWRGPSIMAGIVLVLFLLSRFHGTHVNFAGSTGPHAGNIPQFVPFAIAGAIVVVSGFVVGMFYAAGALHAERRDRSILFWKSLPVSNLTTVLAKFAVPSVVIPIVVFVLLVIVQLAMMVIATAHLVSAGQDASTLWDQVPLMRMWTLFGYAIVVNSLWQAPLWAWLLLVSAWAKRMPILWALGVPLVLCVIERLALNTHYLADLFRDRFLGGLGEAFNIQPHSADIQLSDMVPLHFFSSVGLWVGLAVAVAFLAAAVWVRRRAEPI
jgi:ABC-2 type transport system permease protein